MAISTQASVCVLQWPGCRPSHRGIETGRDDVLCFPSPHDTGSCLAFVVAGLGANCHREDACAAVRRGRSLVNGRDRRSRESASLSETVAVPSVDGIGHGSGARSICVGKGRRGLRHVLRGPAVPAAVEAVVSARLRG